MRHKYPHQKQKIKNIPEIIKSIVSAFGESSSKNEPGSANISRIFAPFIYSSASSNEYAKNELNGEYVDVAGKAGQRAIAAIASRQRINSDTGVYTHSYIFAAASADFFTGEYLGNASYANYDIISAMVQDVARLETAADSSLGGISANNQDSFLGKYLVDLEIKEEDDEIYEWDDTEKKYILVDTIHGLSNTERIVYTVIAAVIPLSIAILGIIVCIRRKYL